MEVFFTIVLLVIAIVLHECAHGWAAYKLGDPTAKMAGRLTLNPIKHIDPVGTILLPGIMIILRLLGQPSVIFGWAKPVPVNFMRLRHPKRDMMWVALAGPVVNILLAVLFAIIVRINLLPLLNPILVQGVFINLLLAVFNMIPIPPLDGGRVLTSLLPSTCTPFLMKLEQGGMIVVFVLLYVGIFDKVIYPIIENIGTILLGVSF